MVLQRCDDNLIAGTNVFATVSLRDQINSLSRTTNEYDLVRTLSIQEMLNSLPSRFIGIRCGLREMMHAAMDIGVVERVIVRNRIDNDLWLLGGGSVVQI